MSGVSSTVRLADMAANIPRETGRVLRQALAAGDEYLASNMPVDTGNMLLSHYGESNQYQATLVSPVYYTIYQEEGFFNVWARRWLPGKWFMKGALDVMDEVVESSLEGLADRL